MGMEGWSGERWRAPDPTFSDSLDKDPIKEAIKVGMGNAKTFLCIGVMAATGRGQATPDKDQELSDESR